MTTTTDRTGTTPTGTGTASDQTGFAGRARSSASSAYEATRERTSALYDSARDRASGAITTSRDTIDANPVVAIAGGLAIGAILGAMLPTSRREQELLGEVGSRVNETAKGVASSAMEAGRTQVDELKANAFQKVGEAVVDAVSTGKTSQSQ